MERDLPTSWNPTETAAARLRGDSVVVDLLNISEVAAALRVSKMTIYRLIHANRLPAIQVGNSFRVHRSDLGVYLSSVFRGPFVKAEEVGSSGPMSSSSDF